MTDYHAIAEKLAGPHDATCHHVTYGGHIVPGACSCSRRERVEGIQEALREAEKARDKHWTDVAQRSFEGVRSWEDMTGGFDDVAEFVLHEVWKRDPRVEAALLAARREGREEAAKLAEDPPVLAFGPGGSEGTRAALKKLTADEFRGLIEDWAEFVAAAIRALSIEKGGE